MSSLTTCEHCGGPAAWTIIDGKVYYSCNKQCAGYAQLDLLRDEFVVGKPTSPEGGNFPHDSEYVEHEGEISELPW